MDKKPLVSSRTYELTYLLAGSMTDAEATAVKSDVETLLKKFKASVVKAEDWGKKPLAYVLRHEGKKNVDAYYMHIVFSLEPAQAPELEHNIFLNNKIMRHLMLLSEDTQAEAAQE